MRLVAIASLNPVLLSTSFLNFPTDIGAISAFHAGFNFLLSTLLLSSIPSLGVKLSLFSYPQGLLCSDSITP